MPEKYNEVSALSVPHECITNVVAPYEYYQRSHWSDELDKKISELSKSAKSGYPIRVAITGIAGSGKTELAKYYAYEHASKSSIVWRIVADTAENLWQSYLSLAGKLKVETDNFLGETEQSRRENICLKVSDMLSEKPGWILIFDNVEKLPEEQYLPKSGNQKGTIIFTTQNEKFFLGKDKCLNISSGLDPNTAIKLLKKIAELEDTSDELKSIESGMEAGSTKLAKMQEYLPLSLLLSAAVIYNHNEDNPRDKWTFGKYIAYVEKLTTKQLNAQQSLYVAQIEGLRVTQYAIIKDAINKLDEESLNLLLFCSYISADNIKQELLKSFIQMQNKDLGENDIDIKYVGLLNKIKKYSLLQQISGESEYAIHRVTQQIGQSYSISAIIADNMVDAVLDKILDHKDNLHTSEAEKVWVPLLFHISALTNTIKAGKSVASPYHKAKLFYYLGKLQTMLGYYSEAINHFKEALEIHNTSLGSNTIDVAEILTDTGVAEWYKNNYDEAIENYQKALKILGIDILDVLKYNTNLNTDIRSNFLYLSLLNNIGLVYQGKGDNNRALLMYEKAYKSITDDLKNKNPLLAIGVLVNIGAIYHNKHFDNKRNYFIEHINNRGGISYYDNKGNAISHDEYVNSENDTSFLVKGLEKYKEALDICQEAGMGGSFKEAEILCNIGGIYDDQGNYEEAVKIGEKALNIYKVLVGENHSKVSELLGYIGLAYWKQGNYAKAVEMFEQVLVIGKAQLDMDYTDVVILLKNIAMVYNMQEKYADAIVLYKQILEINEKFYGADHVEVIASLGNLVAVYCRLKDYNSARYYYGRMLRISENPQKEIHIKMFIKVLDMVGNNTNFKSYIKAKDSHERTLVINEKCFGKDSVEVALNLIHLGTDYLYLREYIKAKVHFERALNIHEKNHIRNNITALALNNLGMVYCIIANYTEAKNCLEQALEIREENYGKNSAEVAETLRLLCTVYDILGNSEKAEECRKRIAESENRDSTK